MTALAQRTGSPGLSAYATAYLVFLYAPVLLIPQVFEPELCRRLIDLYDQHGGEASGVMKEQAGRTVGVHDLQFKSRRDHTIEEAAIRADVPYAAVIAFPDQERNLSTAAKARFIDLKSRAAQQVAFEKKSPADSDAFRKAMLRRDSWLIGIADQAVLVWDESDNRYDRLYADLSKAFGDDLYVIRP